MPGSVRIHKLILRSQKDLFKRQNLNYRQSTQRIRLGDSKLRITCIQHTYQSQVDSYKAPLLLVWEKF